MSENTLSKLTVRDLMTAGLHFGHQTKRWNPKMKRYIFDKRNGIHVIDITQSLDMLEEALKFIKESSENGKKILFVGTKKQAQTIIQEEALRAGMFYVNQRWVGGTLTNFAAIQHRIDYLVRLEDQQSKNELARLPKKESQKLSEEIKQMNLQFGGIKAMTSLPSVLFIVDPSMERIAIAEARRMRIPVVAMVDTNCNPDEIDEPIPSNDDAIRAIKLVAGEIADAILEAKGELHVEVEKNDEISSEDKTDVTI